MNALKKLHTPGGRPYQWLAVLLILGLALVACQDEPEATSAPEAPAATEAPAEAQAAEEPRSRSSRPRNRLSPFNFRLANWTTWWTNCGCWSALATPLTRTSWTPEPSSRPSSHVKATCQAPAAATTTAPAYEADDNGNISVGPAATTRMACEPASMGQEQAYLEALGGAHTYAINEEGRLEIFYDSGANFDEKLVYAPGETPLENTEWLLVEYGDPEDPTAVRRRHSRHSPLRPRIGRGEQPAP